MEVMETDQLIDSDAPLDVVPAGSSVLLELRDNGSPTVKATARE
jgi:hypothetical protein